MSNIHLDTARHPISEGDYVAECRTLLNQDGALVLRKFARSESISQIIHEVAPREVGAHYTSESHNVYLTEAQAAYPEDHPHNLQVSSSKGLIADDDTAGVTSSRDLQRRRVKSVPGWSSRDLWSLPLRRPPFAHKRQLCGRRYGTRLALR